MHSEELMFQSRTTRSSSGSISCMASFRAWRPSGLRRIRSLALFSLRCSLGFSTELFGRLTMARRRTRPGLKRLDFEVIRREFDQTLEFVLNRVERALPELPDIARARKLHARGTLHLAKSYYRAVRHLCVQKPSADVVPPELSVAIAPINRALCELFASSVFMLADFENRWPLFERSGWWENQEEYHRLSRYFKHDPNYGPWLHRFRQRLLIEGAQRLGMSKAEQTHRKQGEYWPNSGRMFDLACPAKADTFKARPG